MTAKSDKKETQTSIKTQKIISEGTRKDTELSFATTSKSSVDDVSETTILGLTGKVGNEQVAVPALKIVRPLSESSIPADIDMKRMAEWTMNYLINTPRKNLDYEPVFQCYPLKCPPTPEGHDVVVPCDTDARMNWEWYYMRQVSGSKDGKDVEAAFHARLLAYVQEDGTVLAPPGCYNEGDIHRVYKKEEFAYHVWGATKILHALAEDYRQTESEQSRATARKIMLRLKRLAVYRGENKCYFPGGMGAVRQDGAILPNGWNAHPAPLIEPLINYFLATGDKEALEFAKAYAEGIINGLQPGGIRFHANGSFSGHSHATMHALWGMAHLGIVTSETKYVEFVKRAWDYMLTRGTGTGWFPAGPANCNETCCISDMISIAACVGRAGHPQYFDYVERYLRNYISNLQFLVSPEFEAYYRKRNQNKGEEAVRKGLDELRKFQGGIIGGSGLNDWENELLGGVSGFKMFGCCAPEGMRAIYTTWLNTIERLPDTPLGPAGVYVNMSFNRESEWGRVVSFMPDMGRLTVKVLVKDTFFVRPPHWAAKNKVLAFVDSRSMPVVWSGAYVRFDAKPGQELTITYPLIRFSHQVEGLWPNVKNAQNLQLTYTWFGNMVADVLPKPGPGMTPLFTGKIRRLPPVPKFD